MSTRSQSSAGEAGTGGGWADGIAIFAAALLFVVAFFQFFEGLVAVLNDDFYVVLENYTINIDTSVWGWVHMGIGVVLALIAAFVLLGRNWARVAGILVACLSMILNFAFLPYYPLFSILVIAVDVLIIWALASLTSASASRRSIG